MLQFCPINCTNCTSRTIKRSLYDEVLAFCSLVLQFGDMIFFNQSSIKIAKIVQSLKVFQMSPVFDCSSDSVCREADCGLAARSFDAEAEGRHFLRVASVSRLDGDGPTGEPPAGLPHWQSHHCGRLVVFCWFRSHAQI